MATRQSNFAATNATAAAIQAWATWLSQGIVSTAGWVQTSDTGQCDTSSLATPGAIHTSVGYQIFRMADSLQTTAPVFLKLEYGSGAAVNTPAIWITLGTGSDGAGNLTGVKLARAQIAAASSSTSTTMTSYLSGDTARLGVTLWGTSPSYAICLVLERTHGASGADTGDGLTALWASSAGRWSQYLPFAGTVPSLYANWNVATPPTGSGALSPNVNFYPVRCWTPGESFPVFGALAYISTDAGTGGSYSVQGYDSNSRTYLMLGGNLPVVGFGNTNNYVGMRFD